MALPPPSPAGTALVTGASSGIGAELARCLARRGHGVTLVARREDRLRELAAELEHEHGVRGEAIGADLGEPDGRDRLAAAIEERGMAVEVLVNNAGFGSHGHFADTERDRHGRMVRLNVEAVVDLCARYLPGMLERRRGAILNVASLAAFQPLPTDATYGATKAFVLSLGDALHSETKGTGVTVTTLCPGPVRTEFVEAAGFEGDVEDSTPGFVWTEVGDVAEQGARGLERGKRVVVPGALIRATGLLGQHAPRAAALPLLKRVWGRF